MALRATFKSPHALSRVGNCGGPEENTSWSGTLAHTHPPSRGKIPKFQIAGKFTRRSFRPALSLTTEFPEHGSGAPAQHEAPACFMALNTLYVQRAFAAQ